MCRQPMPFPVASLPSDAGAAQGLGGHRCARPRQMEDRRPCTAQTLAQIPDSFRVWPSSRPALPLRNEREQSGLVQRRGSSEGATPKDLGGPQVRWPFLFLRKGQDLHCVFSEQVLNEKPCPV
eukprot:TRINITY_DN13731_c0_g1_i1.p1 TRINITY_DN13731_c0_g1~~TRINITY_DN13731_c0_g1_i1.p1  ORF type:complete len:123 (+),score=0.25 TRINITY_DN13731_c0_g1_i1:52-420(+)